MYVSGHVTNQSYTIRILSVYQSYTSRIPIVYQSYTSRIPVVYQSYTSSIPVVYHHSTSRIPSYTTTVPAVYHRIPPKTSRIPIVYHPYTNRIPSVVQPYTTKYHSIRIVYHLYTNRIPKRILLVSQSLSCQISSCFSNRPAKIWPQEVHLLVVQKAGGRLFLKHFVGSTLAWGQPLRSKNHPSQSPKTLWTHGPKTFHEPKARYVFLWT